MRRGNLICSFTSRTFENTRISIYDYLNVSFDPNQKFCKEATKSKFPDIVDEGGSVMNINNIWSDLSFAHSTGINNICLVIFEISYYIIQKSAI